MDRLISEQAHLLFHPNAGAVHRFENVLEELSARLHYPAHQSEQFGQLFVIKEVENLRNENEIEFGVVKKLVPKSRRLDQAWILRCEIKFMNLPITSSKILRVDIDSHLSARVQKTNKGRLTFYCFN
jgi:hypothetical protein